MDHILTEEEKKILRFIANKYLASLGMTSGTIDLRVDEWKSTISFDHNSFFSNRYRAEIPNSLIPIIEKIVDYGNEVIEDPDVEINYQAAEIVISSEKQKIALVYDYYYYEEGDSEVSSWEAEDDEDVKEILESLNRFKITKKIIHLNYNGSGDSGSIESTFDNHEDVPKEVEDWCYSKLENLHGGWEINEGSSGYFSFNLEEGEIELYHTNNIEEHESKILYEESFLKSS